MSTNIMVVTNREAINNEEEKTPIIEKPIIIASIKNTKHVKVKVWERGAGLTKACGTAACATAVSGAVLKLSERNVNIESVSYTHLTLPTNREV